MSDPDALTESAPATPEAPSATSQSTWFWDVVHLFSLSAIVFAQPLLDRLQHNPGFLTQEGLDATDLLILAAWLLLGPPLVLLCLEVLARLRSAGTRRKVHLALMAGLFMLLGVSLLKRPFEVLRAYGIPGGWLSLLLLAYPVYRLMRTYSRQGWVYSLLSIAAIGLVVFPVQFFRSHRISAICFPPPPSSDQPHAENPVPIVMIVFDGLSGVELLNHDRDIDAIRYPNFARLAGMSHYYRNATTVHYRTDNAVPAILTGNIPPGNLPPFIGDYPVNLFTLLRDSQQYDQTVFEPYTRLCPSELRYLPIKRTRWERIRESASVLLTVFRQTSIPHDLPGATLNLPRSWLRLPEPQHESREETKGLFIYPWDGDRHDQVEHFLRSLQPDERPTLRFLHLVIPHYPWIYLPSGHRYVTDSSMYDFPIGAHGILGERWGPDVVATRSAHRRYLLQLQYVDHVLGRFLDRLEEQNLLDPALLVVTGDHGVAFIPNKSSRDPDKQTLAAIMPVPLFIKLPGETTPVVSDRNVEAIDVLPTIADVLKMELHHPVDGSSLLDADEPQRPRKTLVTPSGPIYSEPDFPDKYRHLKKVLADFGDGRDDRLMQPEIRPDLFSRSVSDFAIGPDSQAQLRVDWGDSAVLESQPDVYPCFYKGAVSNPDDVKLPITIAVALNGEIAGITHTLLDPESPELWSVLIDERRFHLGENDLAFYQVTGQGKKTVLRRCEWKH